MNLINKAGAVRVYTDNGQIRSSNFNDFKVPTISSEIDRGPASIKTGFRNCTNTSVVVKDRHNVPLIIPVDTEHKQLSHERGFYVFKVYTFQSHTVSGVLMAVRELSDRLGKNLNSEELFSLRRALENNRNSSPHMRVVVEHMYSFQERDFDRDDIYDARTDLIISRKPVVDVSMHPMSPHFVDQNCLKDQQGLEDDTVLGTTIRYINRRNPKQCKFVNMLGTVHKLSAISDAPAFIKLVKDGKTEREVQLDEYVEICETACTALDNQFSDPGLNKTILTVEEAALRFGIYDCSGDAKVYGNPDKMLEREASAAKQSLLLLQEQFAREKIEREARERDRQLESERERREQQEDFDRRKRDDEYRHQQTLNDMRADFERRSSTRKDWTEWFKFITGLLASIAAIALAVIKLKPAEAK